LTGGNVAGWQNSFICLLLAAFVERKRAAKYRFFETYPGLLTCMQLRIEVLLTNFNKYFTM